jgi:hypothetical protein
MCCALLPSDSGHEPRLCHARGDRDQGVLQLRDTAAVDHARVGLGGEEGPGRLRVAAGGGQNGA